MKLLWEKKGSRKKGEEGNAAGERRGGESQAVSQRCTDVAEEGFFIVGGSCVVVALMVLCDSEQQQLGKVCTALRYLKHL